MPVGDEGLMARSRRGDTDAFGALAQRHSGPVFRYLVRMTGSREAAEDLMQETFLAAYNARDTYEPNGRFTAWLYTIAANQARNYLRARASGRGDRPVAPTQRPLPGPGPEEAYFVRELQDAVRASVRALSVQDREAILLREIGGLSYAELGVVMECSRGAARVRVHRARRRLRHLLEPYFETQAARTEGGEAR